LPLALAAPSAVGSAKLLKKLTHRSRPGWSRFKRKGRESFPSSHVAGHAAVLASLACLTPRTNAWRVGLALGGGLVAALGAERICAGRHWPSDVLVGAALGIGVGIALGGMAGPRPGFATRPIRDEAR
jgi:undecaprenyl-diphosphatase